MTQPHERMKMDLTKVSNQLIVAGLAGMIDDEGLTMHEAFDVLEDIKRNIFPALMEMQRERKVSYGQGKTPEGN